MTSLIITGGMMAATINGITIITIITGSMAAVIRGKKSAA